MADPRVDIAARIIFSVTALNTDLSRSLAAAVLDATDAVQASEVAAWHAECDKVGIPHDPATLVRHHRANAALAATFDARTQAMRQASEVAQLQEAAGVLLRCMDDAHDGGETFPMRVSVAASLLRERLAGSESPTNPDATP